MNTNNKVWEVMNDLEMVTSKIVSAREIIDTVADAIQKNDYDRAETLAMAAYEFLGYYLEEFDEKFKLAWNETVKKQKSESYWEESYLQLYNRFKRFARYTDQELDEMCDSKEKEEDDGMRPWGHSDMEYLTATGEKFVCDRDDPSPECKGAWNSFWEENYYPEESNQYTEEELNAMCDAAVKVDGYSVDGKSHSEYYYDYTRNDPDRPNPFKTKINYDEAIAAGWRMTDDGIWMPPQETPKKKWILPVEQVHDDYFVSFPDDLLKTAKLKEGDEVNWVDNGDGSFKIVKVLQPLGPDEC